MENKIKKKRLKIFAKERKIEKNNSSQKRQGLTAVQIHIIYKYKLKYISPLPSLLHSAVPLNLSNDNNKKIHTSDYYKYIYSNIPR